MSSKLTVQDLVDLIDKCAASGGYASASVASFLRDILDDEGIDRAALTEEIPPHVATDVMFAMRSVQQWAEHVIQTLTSPPERSAGPESNSKTAPGQ